MSKPNYKRRYPGMPKAFYAMNNYVDATPKAVDFDLDTMLGFAKNMAMPDKDVAKMTKFFKLQTKNPEKFRDKLHLILEEVINNYIDWRNEQKPAAPEKEKADKVKDVEPDEDDEADDDDEEADDDDEEADDDEEDDDEEDDDEEDDDDDDDDDFDDEEDEDDDEDE